MGKARIGVIGVGWWGTVGHLDPLSQDDRVEVVAVYSRTEEKAKERAAKYGVPRYYTDYRRMIDECALDGVCIATTPNVHYEQARYALEHSVHVLMEKPFVLKAEQATDLAGIAQAKGLLLSVCYPACFHPWAVEARDYVRKGSLGQIMLMNRLFTQRVIDLYRGDVSGMFGHREGLQAVPNAMSYCDPNIAGGGEGHTQATHAIGGLLWLVEMKPVSVFAYMNNLDCAVDVVDAMTIRFQGGGLATVSANGLVPHMMGADQTQIVGEKGIFSMGTRGYSASIWLEGDQKPREFAQPERVNTVALVPRNFVRTILGEESLHVSTQVAVDTVKILDAAYRSAASGQLVEIH